MTRTFAQSNQAIQALQLVSALQQRFVTRLEKAAVNLGLTQTFQEVEWLRDGGAHGGGSRFETTDGAMIGRGSVNVSQIHYDNNPDKQLGSATAISTIIHPIHPLAPSVHIHISWTEMKSGNGYWRIMADLNPAIENIADTATFFKTLQSSAPQQFENAKLQGEQYFYIPAVNRHRGVVHFYLESFHSGNIKEDLKLARSVGEAAMDTYVSILETRLAHASPASDAEKAQQLAYHTLYFFQVLTLDRGTTTGLLVHNQNDVGILGSLPAFIDRELLLSWQERLQSPQNDLLQTLIDELSHSNPTLIDVATKKRLAQAAREFYIANPNAIDMQASGYITPPTVNNHR